MTLSQNPGETGHAFDLSTSESLIRAGSGKSSIVFTDWEKLKAIFGINLTRPLGGGAQARVYACERSPGSLAKTGNSEELFTEAVAIALMTGGSREIIVSSAKGQASNISQANEICIIVPKAEGVSHESALEVAKTEDASRLRPINLTAIHKLGAEIVTAEAAHLRLFDIQLRQIVLDGTTSAKFVDFSTAQIGYYDEKKVINCIDTLRALSEQGSFPNAHTRKELEERLGHLLKDLNFQDDNGGVIDSQTIGVELAKHSAELLLLKLEKNLPENDREKILDLSNDISSALRPTWMNKLFDLILDRDYTTKWGELPANIINSVAEANKYLDATSLGSWMQENPQQFADQMTQMLQKAFLKFDQLDIRRTYDIEGNNDWDAIRQLLVNFSTGSYKSRVGQDRTTAYVNILEKIGKVCGETDLGVCDGTTNDLLTLSSIISNVLVGTEMNFDISTICALRRQLISALQEKNSTIGKGLTLQQYFEYKSIYMNTMNILSGTIPVHLLQNSEIVNFTPVELDDLSELVQEKLSIVI